MRLNKKIQFLPSDLEYSAVRSTKYLKILKSLFRATETYTVHRPIATPFGEKFILSPRNQTSAAKGFYTTG